VFQIVAQDKTPIEFNFGCKVLKYFYLFHEELQTMSQKQTTRTKSWLAVSRNPLSKQDLVV
jgi:hypothetical protein